MKILFLFFLVLVNVYAMENDKTFKFVPIVSSNPTSGTGAGGLGVMMYEADNSSSPSQAILMAQYTDTDSYNIFAINKMFFNSDKWQSNTMVGYIYNNSSFDISTSGLDLPYIPDIPEVLTPNYEVKIFSAVQNLMYMVKDNLYIGGHIFYVGQDFNAKNLEGEWFLRQNGIESVNRAGIGLALSFDTRSKDEKFYPKNAIYANLMYSAFPEFLGSDTSFSSVMLNARYYKSFGKEDDVLALQYFGQFCSEDTPDGALSALGARNIIRGFPIGKYKTRYMNAIQSEYRYTIKNTSFRIAPFVGYANLSGGSKGTQNGNRDDNNGDYYSGGIGVHYILAKKYQLDYRVDVAYSSDEETSVYASINQAF
jgi:hypothetical protein